MGNCTVPYLTVVPLAPKIHADLLWDLTILFGVLGLVYFLFIFFFRNSLAYKSRAVSKRKKELGPMISNFLFYEDDASLQEKYDYVQLKLEVRQLLKDGFNRKILVEILLDLQKDISGDARNRLFDLYRNLGLHLDAFAMLKSRRWEVISRGILELTQLHVEESYGFIKKFVNHRRGVIRKQAQLATVSLKHEGIIYFLDTCKYRISEWQQLKLLDVIRNLDDFEPPRFKAWLTSKNKDVVLFALRLIKYYKQNDASASLIELVKHKNDQIKIEAINCIKEFYIFDALDTLKAVFRNCNTHVKLTVLDAISNLGKEKEIIFLKKVEKEENSFIVKSKALSALNTISPGTVLPTKDIQSIAPYPEDEEELIPDPAAVAEEQPEDAISGKPGEEPISDMELQNEAYPKEEPAEKESPEEQKAEIPVEMRPDTAEQQEGVSNDPKYGNAGPWDELELAEEPSEWFHKEFELPEVSGEMARWDALLDPEKEDEEIFEVCFLEELRDILAEADSPEKSFSEHEILPLDFLPIVVREKLSRKDKNEGALPHILEMEVDFETVHENEKFSVELNRILKRIRASGENEEEAMLIDFIPLVVDPQTTPEIRDPESMESGPLTDFSVEYEEVRSAQESFKTVSKEPTSDLSEILSSEKLRSIEVVYEEQKSQITPADDKFEEQKSCEISPLLAERISIFNELFRTCDAESKLILLDEILAVGDERDLKFLDTLSTDEDNRVRKKALRIKEQLKLFLEEAGEEKTKLNSDHPNPECLNDDKSIADPGIEAPEESVNTLQPLEFCLLQGGENKTPKISDILEVHFELNPIPDTESDNTKKELNEASSESSFLDEILSIPSKIIQKLNG